MSVLTFAVSFVFYCLFLPFFLRQALELISNNVGPDEPAPSQGNNNPAVMKYDPTGLRTTMSTSDKAWEESLKVGTVDAMLECVDAIHRVFFVGIYGAYCGVTLAIGKQNQLGILTKQATSSRLSPARPTHARSTCPTTTLSRGGGIRAWTT